MNGFSEAGADHGGWIYELAEHRTIWSEAVYRIHGVSPDRFEPTLEAVARLVHPDDLAAYRRAFRKALAARSPFAVQHRIVRPDGEPRTLLVRGSYVAGEDGGPGRFVGTTEDITGRASEQERLWQLANRDELTGLFNRRRFMEELQARWQWRGATGPRVPC